MVVCVPIAADGTIDGSWGRAARVLVVRVDAGTVISAEGHDVRWDVLHDAGPEGSHHARIARFLIDHEVEAVVAHHMGPPMVRMLGQMGIRTVLGASGDPQRAALAVVADATG